MRCFYVLKKWSSAKVSLNRNLSLMPIPSASSKIIFTMFKFFWACSIFFEHSQIFWSCSKARFYLINLHIWAWSKIFEHIQKILNTIKNIWTWSKNIWISRWIRHQNKTWFWICYVLQKGIAKIRFDHILIFQMPSKVFPKVLQKIDWVSVKLQGFLK